MTTNLNSHLSRRKLFGLGAGAAAVGVAGVSVLGGSTAAFATSGDDKDMPAPVGGISTTDHFTNGITRLPGTQLAVFGPADMYSLNPLHYPADGGVYCSPTGSIEIGLNVPPGAIIRQVNVFGVSDVTSSQSWKFQVYEPTVFGALSNPALYQATSNTGVLLDAVFPIPASGLVTSDAQAYAVYGAVSPTSRLYGVAVQYTLPPAPAIHGYTPINPARVYDSRAAAPAPGVLAANQNRVVSIKDGRNGSGAVVAADIVPPNATAVTFNVTATGTTGPNFLAVAPGDAAGFSTSSLNWPGDFDIANASTVKLDGSRQVKVFMGDQPGSAHFIIDITGYYF